MIDYLKKQKTLTLVVSVLAVYSLISIAYQVGLSTKAKEIEQEILATPINETEEKKVLIKLNKYISHCSTRSQFGEGYSCSNLYDDEFLSWQDNGENCKDGYIIFTFAEPVEIKFVVFQNLEQDREFMRNWKAREILYSTPDPDYSYTFELENTNTAQWITVEEVVTTEFTIQILSAYPSESSKDGAPGFPECAIQEIEFFGYIANPSQALDLVNSLKDTKTQEQKNKEMEIGAEIFRNNWINNIIKTYPLLTEYESTLSNAIEWDTPFIIDDEFQCSRKSGMVYSGFINEDYPLTPSFDISEQQSYTCEGGINIIGEPFLQDEQWWVFREVQSYNQEGNCFNKIDINEPCPFDIELPKEILEGNYSLTMPYFHLAERYPVQGIETPSYVWFCDPDPYARECQYDYNPTTISLWEYSKFWISTWRTISQWDYQTRWDITHSLKEEYPQELIEIFNSPAFSIRVDDLTYDCYVHPVHNSNYLPTDGIYPQPLETVAPIGVDGDNFLVFPTLYWDCVDDIKDLGFESPSQTGAEIYYQGQGPPVLRGDLGNVNPNPINGSWVMWGPEAPYNGSNAAFEFEIVEFYWWYEYEDGFFSIDELCEGGRDTFTYEEDYQTICSSTYNLENRERRGVVKTFRDTAIPNEIITNSKGMADKNYSNKTIVPDSEEVTYEINYLHLNPDYLGECAEVINANTLKFINTRIAWEEETASYYGKEEAEADGYTSYINWVNLTYNLVGIDTDADVFSIFYHWNTYSSGAAHPITSSFSLNYDLRDCERIDILEIFNIENNNYIDILNREILLQLCATERNIDKCHLGSRYNNLLDNNEEWYNLPRSILFNDPTSFAVGQYGLFIQFWEYDFGYSGGQPLILIPWFDLMPILDRNSKYADGFLRGFCIYDKYNFTSFEPKWSWVCEDVNE